MIDRFLRRLSVRTRIVGGFLILILLLTLSIPLSVANYTFLVDRLRQVTNVEAEANRALLLASARIASSRVNLMRYVDNQVPSPTEALDDADSAASLLTDVLDRGLISSPDQQQDVTRVMQALAEYRTLITDIEAERQQSPDQDNARKIFQAYRLGNDSGLRIEQIVQDSEDHITAANASVEADAQGRLWFLTGTYVAALFLGLVLTLFIQRSITRPVASLRNAAEAFRQGHFDTTIAVTGADELSLLAQTFNQMTAQLSKSYLDLEQRVAARTGQLQASVEVSRAATSILSPEQLLPQVATLITEHFGFYYTAVFVLDEASQQAVLRAATGEAGQALLARNHRLPVDGKSMVGTAIISGQPQIALDVGAEAVRFANPLLPNTRSEIALPLRVGDRSLGALDVQSEEAGAFDESNTAVLQSMADQIAVALFNAESFQHSERQANIMLALNQLSRDLSLASSLEDTAVAVKRAVTRLLGEQLLSVAQTTANPQFVSLRSFERDAEQPLGEPLLMRVADSVIAECLERRSTIYLADLSQTLEQYSDSVMAYQLGLRSTVTLALHAGDRVLGTLNVGAHRAQAYSAEQINQLELIAAQVAVTIENLNLAEQTQQTLAELNAANRQLIGQAWEQYTRAAKLEAAEWHAGQWTVADQPAPQLETSRAMQPVSQTVSLPIKVRGTTIGEFHITAADARSTWEEEDTTFAQSLVDQVGQVLENARLLDETERLARRERTINEINARVRQSVDLDAILRTAVNELGQSLKAVRVVARVGTTTAEDVPAIGGRPREAE